MATITFRQSLRTMIAAGFSCLVATGCDSTPKAVLKADYTATLNKYYDGRPVCVWPENVKFPVVDATPEDIHDRGFTALADAGLLIRKSASKRAAQGSASFDLSPEGSSAFDKDISDAGAGNFCYGRRKVVAIERDQHDTPSTERIDYRYSVDDAAAWAREIAVQRAFPRVVSELAGPHKAEVTLLDTTNGWQVSGTPAVIPINNTAPKGSTLAKAKSLLTGRKQHS